MTLTVTNVTDNASLPLSAADTYLPDQLIADPRTVITMSATIGGGAKLIRGTVLGMVSEGGLTGTAVEASGATGNGVISSINFGINARPGIYTVSFNGATTYTVTDPNGVPLVAAGVKEWGPGANQTEIGFTFTAGSSAMVAGDEIQIVAEPSGLSVYRPSKASSNDGSEVPSAILVDIADASAGNVSGGVYVRGEFNANALTIDASFTLTQVVALLGQKGIFCRTPVSASDPS